MDIAISTSNLQSDYQVSVYLMYCNRQVQRDFLITLCMYLPILYNFSVSLKYVISLSQMIWELVTIKCYNTVI
jgi:hypothetical protein